MDKQQLLPAALSSTWATVAVALPVLTLPVLSSGNLIYRRLVEPEVLRHVGIIWRAGHVLSPAATAFLDLVRGVDLSSEVPDPFGPGG